MYCYFNDVIKIEDFDPDNILIDNKPHENILDYNILYKILIDSNLCIRFDKIDGFIWVYDGSRYLVLFESENDDSISNKIRSFICVKSGITYIMYHDFAKTKVDSFDSLPLEKTMTFCDLIILIKSDWNKDESNYYYNILLEELSYELLKK